MNCFYFQFKELEHLECLFSVEGISLPLNMPTPTPAPETRSIHDPGNTMPRSPRGIRGEPKNRSPNHRRCDFCDPFCNTFPMAIWFSKPQVPGCRFQNQYVSGLETRPNKNRHVGPRCVKKLSKWGPKTVPRQHKIRFSTPSPSCCSQAPPKCPQGAKTDPQDATTEALRPQNDSSRPQKRLLPYSFAGRRMM